MREGWGWELCQPVSLPVYPGWASLASVPSEQPGDGWIAVKCGGGGSGQPVRPQRWAARGSLYLIFH